METPAAANPLDSIPSTSPTATTPLNMTATSTMTTAHATANGAPASISTDAAASLKRKRSPSISSPAVSAPAAKAVKPNTHLSINYLARQSPEDLPLINKDDALPSLLHLLSSYSNILDRHESLASNLGARPLGPILIKRFERCFDAPPRIVASHYKANGADDAAHQITWLEVIEFARSHPGQFTLSTFSEGRRVCQFYYPQKQLRVQISEEDFLFINSGRCQELIPPLPIWEDEEKEVGTCDVLETRLKELTNAADMVAARTRQLSHRLKGRRAAILERRAEGGSGTPAKANAVQTTLAPPPPPPPAAGSSGGFVAVNALNGRSSLDGPEAGAGASLAVRNELMRHFESLPHNQAAARLHARNLSNGVGADPQPSQPLQGVLRQAEPLSHVMNEGAHSTTSSLSPAPPTVLPVEALAANVPAMTSSGPVTSNTATYSSNLDDPNAAWAREDGATDPSSRSNTSNLPIKHNFSRPLPAALESSQPFRPICQAHMDSLPRGHRVLPPCDRCRRLRMDCVKNLTSCAGCTRKHARCHWRDVQRDELGSLDHVMDSLHLPGADYSPTHATATHRNGTGNGAPSPSHEPNSHRSNDSDDDEESNPLGDLEALEAQVHDHTDADRVAELHDMLSLAGNGDAAERRHISRNIKSSVAAPDSSAALDKHRTSYDPVHEHAAKRPAPAQNNHYAHEPDPSATPSTTAPPNPNPTSSSSHPPPQKSPSPPPSAPGFRAVNAPKPTPAAPVPFTPVFPADEESSSGSTLLDTVMWSLAALGPDAAAGAKPPAASAGAQLDAKGAEAEKEKEKEMPVAASAGMGGQSATGWRAM